jgi:cytochrome b561
MASAAAMTGQEAARYTAVAIALHWIIALLLLANLFLGFGHGWFGKPAEAWLMFFHKATGITILVLTLARLAWRLSHRPPPHDAALKRWEASLAGLIHAAFYVALIAVPLTGWLLSSSSGRPTNYFGLFTIPPLPVSRSDAAHDLFEEAHELLGLLTIGLIGLHVAGALKHHFEGHRHMIGRMAPWVYRGR